MFCWSQICRAPSFLKSRASRLTVLQRALSSTFMDLHYESNSHHWPVIAIITCECHVSKPSNRAIYSRNYWHLRQSHFFGLSIVLLCAGVMTRQHLRFETKHRIVCEIFIVLKWRLAICSAPCILYICTYYSYPGFFDSYLLQVRPEAPRGARNSWCQPCRWRITTQFFILSKVSRTQIAWFKLFRIYAVISLHLRP